MRKKVESVVLRCCSDEDKSSSPRVSSCSLRTLTYRGELQRGSSTRTARPQVLVSGLDWVSQVPTTPSDLCALLQYTNLDAEGATDTQKIQKTFSDGKRV
ncbi:hypothetical protein AOLI_G00188960 [Acnodon oligacanthus]